MSNLAIVLGLLLLTVWYNPEHAEKVVDHMVAPFMQQECSR